MDANKLNEIRKPVAAKRPLIHCITNPISINQCANGILAVGASPMMAEHPQEVAEITQTAGALLLNMGNITDVRMQSMEISAQTAAQHNVPVVFDIVGMSCSTLRRNFVNSFLNKFTPAVIKGNYSEIAALYNSDYISAGVDSQRLDENYVATAATALAKKYNSVILASGKRDIVTDGKTLVFVANGVSQLANITGTGCLQGALCATFISADSGLWGAVCGCVVMGIAGQLAVTDKGNGTFFVNLMDSLSLFNDSHMEKYLDMEVKAVEKS